MGWCGFESRYGELARCCRSRWEARKDFEIRNWIASDDDDGARAVYLGSGTEGRWTVRTTTDRYIRSIPNYLSAISSSPLSSVVSTAIVFHCPV